MTDDLEPPEYDDGYSDDAGFELLGATTLELVQQKSLRLFGEFVERMSGVKMPVEIPEHSEKYLPLNELEAIIRDYAVVIPGGWAVGAATAKDATQKLKEMLDAILQRILSNVMADGVHRGWLDCDFNADTGRFEFSLTDAGQKIRSNGRSDQ